MSKDDFDTSRHYPRLIESLPIKVSDLRSVPPAQGIGPSVASSVGGIHGQAFRHAEENGE